MSEENVGELCRACGLCCDGTLFTFVAVEEARLYTLRVEGLDVREGRDGRFTLRQPCAGLQGTTCRIYDARPQGCRDFHCLLAVALKQGETTLDEAKGLVATFREKLDHLAQILPPEREPSGLSLVQRARRDGVEDRAWWVSFDASLKAYFRGGP